MGTIEAGEPETAVSARGSRPAPTRRSRSRWPGVATTAVIAGGGAVGALARYGLAVGWPSDPTGFPRATFVTNVGGCFLIGMLLVLVVDVWVAHRLLRPFLGTGVLGGFTTFSTYAVDIQSLLRADRAPLALGYLAATVVAGLLAAWLGMLLTRLVTRVHHPTRTHDRPTRTHDRPTRTHDRPTRTHDRRDR